MNNEGKKILKIGSVGTSLIMEAMQEGFHLTEGLCSKVIYSRNLERGQAFAEKHGVEEACDDYEAMISRDDIGVIYIASPNSLHTSQVLAALRHGKHVIVEKPAAVTVEEVELMAQTARENGVFFLEAITTLFMPNFVEYRKARQKLNRIRRAVVSFGNRSSRYDDLLNGKLTNVFDPAMQGGALNDMGIYCVHTAVDLFGKPEKVIYNAKFADNGADIGGVLTLTYSGYQDDYNEGTYEVKLLVSKCETLESGCRIWGDTGELLQQGQLNEFSGICKGTIFNEEVNMEVQPQGNRTVYELARFRDAILEHDEEFFEHMVWQSKTAAWILEEAHRSTGR